MDGAAGISTYNYMYHWDMRTAAGQPKRTAMWPTALRYLAELSDAASLENRPRHYLYPPLWGRECHTGAVKNDRIVLRRGAAPAEGEFAFRLAEDLADPRLSAVLEFKVTGMADGDELAISLNGHAIAPAALAQSYHQDGQLATVGRQLPAFHLYRIEPARGRLSFGDNRLKARLLHSAGKEPIDIQEVEVKVAVQNKK
jgi:hypothetical protein